MYFDTQKNPKIKHLTSPLRIGLLTNFLKIILGHLFCLDNILMNPIPCMFDFVLNLWFQYQYLYPSFTSDFVSVCKHEGIVWLAGGDLWMLKLTHGSFTSPPALPASHTEQNHADTSPSVQPTAMNSQQAETPHRSASMLTSNTDFDIEWTANRTCAIHILWTYSQ